VDELSSDEQRSRVREVAHLALVDAVLRLFEPRVRERQGHRPREVLDGTDLVESLLQPRRRVDVGPPLSLCGCDARLPALVSEQPVEAVYLKGEKVGYLKRFPKLGEGEAARAVLGLRGSGRDGQQGSFRGHTDGVNRMVAPSPAHEDVSRRQRKAAV